MPSSGPRISSINLSPIEPISSSLKSISRNPFDTLIKMKEMKVAIAYKKGGELSIAVGHSGDEHISITVRAWGKDWQKECRSYGGGRLKLISEEPLELSIEGSATSLDNNSIPLYMERRIIKELTPHVVAALAAAKK